jgi:hypothetical protein
MSILIKNQKYRRSRPLTRRVLIEKTRTYPLVKFGVPTDTEKVYVNNFEIPEESLYVLEDAPETTDLDISKIVALSKVTKYKDGCYAENVTSITITALGNWYIDMLHKGQLEIHMASTGIIQDGIVNHCKPFCLYFQLSR